jgi:hypothetical protein
MFIIHPLQKQASQNNEHTLPSGNNDHEKACSIVFNYYLKELQKTAEELKRIKEAEMLNKFSKERQLRESTNSK